MTTAVYEGLVQQLYKQNVVNPVKLGLQNVQRLYQLMQRPLDGVPIVHVAGTNGKGSVCIKLAKTLEYSGLKTGLFVSPHISSFRERIQVNSRLISEEEIVERLPRIFELCRQNDIPATFFEMTTALAFENFARARCDAVVLEVGLGGRFDATNVVTPALSVISSIGLDHTKILGDTIEQIAMEKAGIMKPNVPVLVGDACPQNLMREHASIHKSPLFVASEVLNDPMPQTDDVDDVNKHILRAAIQLLKQRNTSPFDRVTDEALTKGLEQRPPCRFEQLEVECDGKTVEVVLDIGHNPPAVATLQVKAKAYARRLNKGIRMIIGMSRDKDILSSLRMLGEVSSKDKISFVQAAHPRATPVRVLESMFHRGTFDEADAREPVDMEHTRRTVTDQLRKCAESGDILLVCGTAFIMAEVRAALGIVEPRDSSVLSQASGSYFKDAQEYFQTA